MQFYSQHQCDVLCTFVRSSTLKASMAKYTSFAHLKSLIFMTLSTFQSNFQSKQNHWATYCSTIQTKSTYSDLWFTASLQTVKIDNSVKQRWRDTCRAFVRFPQFTAAAVNFPQNPCKNCCSFPTRKRISKAVLSSSFPKNYRREKLIVSFCVDLFGKIITSILSFVFVMQIQPINVFFKLLPILCELFIFLSTLTEEPVPSEAVLEKYGYETSDHFWRHRLLVLSAYDFLQRN